MSERDRERRREHRHHRHHHSRSRSRSRRRREESRSRSPRDRRPPVPTAAAASAAPVRREEREVIQVEDVEVVKKKVPVSLEDLAKAREERQKEMTRPVFVSREERERRALEERQREVAEMREKANQRVRAVLGSAKPTSDDDPEHEERSREAALAKERFFGKPKPEKKVMKPGDKARAARSFDWDPADDTLGEQAVASRPLFGKGWLAGFDHREQVKMFGGSSSSSSTLVGGPEVKAAEGHWSAKDLSRMTERDWRIFKEDYSIVTRGTKIPAPLRTWTESGSLPDDVLRGIMTCGYKTPTAVQMSAIPIGLQFRDLIGISVTGSGKTAAFVIPMLVYIGMMPPLTTETEAEGPYALIMAPSRELVKQIEAETIRLASGTRVRVVSLVGGVSLEEQGCALRRGCEIVVATPARVMDCIAKRYVVLNQCNYVVLDEADKMIDMGFEAQVNAVLDAMPSSNLKSLDEAEAELQERNQAAMISSIAMVKAGAGYAAAVDARAGKVFRTTVMFSATMPPALERMARKYLRRPAQVLIGNVGQVAEAVTQTVMWMTNENEKRKHLAGLLRELEPPVMVFMNKKKAADAMVKQLQRDGYRAVALHASRTQDQREAAMNGFKAGRYDILVCTDVAGRGIDVHGVTAVVNYDMPSDIQKYTHRVGRTGRAGLRGQAISFLSADDTDIMYDLKKMLLDTKNLVPAELDRHPSSSIPKQPTNPTTTSSSGAPSAPKQSVVFLPGTQ